MPKKTRAFGPIEWLWVCGEKKLTKKREHFTIHEKTEGRIESQYPPTEVGGLCEAYTKRPLHKVNR
ncbi:MAG: hypothetical protein OXU51_23995 [Candidatus Poribacteria bacterium]|nr:hypothetical protein [Candidatus Poribacteria bacterium]